MRGQLKLAKAVLAVLGVILLALLIYSVLLGLLISAIVFVLRLFGLAI